MAWASPFPGWRKPRLLAAPARASRAALTAGAAGARRAAAASRRPTGPARARRAAAPPSSQRSNAYGQRGWKRQPGGGRDGSGTSPGSASGSVPAPSACGTAPISASVYGWSGVAQSSGGRRRLDDPAEVHDRDGVGDVADDREVVRDQQQAELELAGERGEEVRDLRLRRGVERGERLVEHDHGRARRRAPARSRCAAAGRPRTRAGSLRAAAAGRPTWSSSVATRAPTAAQRGRAPSDAQRLADLLADPAPRVERRERVLEHHLQPRELARTRAAGRAAGPRCPSKRIVPAAGATMPTAARASVDLPQPDSPTRPTIWPRSTSRLAPATARTGLEPAALVLDDDVLELERAHCHRAAGRRDRRAAARSPARAAAPARGRILRVGAARDGRRSRAGRAAARAAPPGSATSGVAAASGCGSASRRPRVYGWRGRPSTSVAAARLDDAARVEHGDPVGDRREDAEVVRDEDDREARLAPEPVEQADDPGLDGDVERGRRLVGDEQPRPAGERDGDRDPLAHPARELVREGVQRALRIGDPHLAQQLERVLAASLLPSPRCRRTCSVSCVPIDSIGCRDVIGSWKTIASSRPQIRRSSRARQPEQVAPLEERRGRRRSPPAGAGPSARAPTSSCRCRSRRRCRRPRRSRRA